MVKKMYMEKDMIEYSQYQMINLLNQRKITLVQFYLILLIQLQPLLDGNGRTCKILFLNGYKIIKSLIEEKI